MDQEHSPDEAFLSLQAHNAIVREREQARRRRRRRASLAASGAAALAGLGLIGYGIVVESGSPAGAAPAARTPAQRAAPAVRAAPATHVVRRPARHGKPTVTLVVRAVDGDSWLELREGSATGRVLYRGTLTRGRIATARGRRLWARFGSAAHLALTLNGEPVEPAPTGTLDALVTPGGLR